MNISATFIQRPVATTLLTIGLALAGAVAFRLLPVSPLPAVDFPTIFVSARLPGADPETMATSVAAPLEAPVRPHRGRHGDDFGELTGLDEHYAPVRPGPRHQRRGQGRPGGDQRGPELPAAEPAEPADLPQGQSRRRAHPHPGPHVRHPHHRARCTTRHPAS